MGYEPVTSGVNATKIQGREVAIGSPLDGYDLKWDADISKWLPQPDVASSGAEWGDITGTLSDQTDLQSELDAKLPSNAISINLVVSTLGTPPSDNAFLLVRPDGVTKYGALSDIDAQPADADLTTWAGITPGTGVGTALAINIGSAGAPILFNGALGTPSSGTGTNLTGIPESGVTNLVSDLALKAPLASPTFTGTVTLPSGQALIAPALGTPASGVVTNLTGTANININGTVGGSTPTTGAFTTLTNTGAAVNSAAGATSAPALKVTGVPFAGTGTTSFPLVYINDANATASTTLNTAGTYFGVNGDGAQDLMNLLKDGTSMMKVSSVGLVTLPAGGIFSVNNQTTIASDNITTISTGFFQFSGRSYIDSIANGNITLHNNAGSSFSLLQFGGTTGVNSHPAIGRDAVNGFTLQSAAGTATWNDPSTANSGTVANRYLFGIAAPTLTSTGTSVTDTVASTVYIGGAPTASTNTTIGTDYALNVAAGTTSLGGTTIHGGVSRLKGYTVSTLPAGTQGDTAFVTDALAPAFLTTLVGGGSAVSPAFYDGTTWKGM